MNIQSVIAEAQARADANGDGKLSADDIQSLGNDNGIDQGIIDKLKEHADANGDGKIDPSDIGHALQNPGTLIDSLKDLFSGNKT